MLQLLGLITTAWGIADTRRLFGQPSVFESAKSWLARRPQSKVVFITGTGHISLTGGSAILSAGSTAAPSGSSLEDRIARLEQWLPLIQDRAGKLEVAAEKEVTERKEADAAEQKTRAADDRKLADKLEISATGGLKLTAVGLVCLVAGTALAGFGPDIAILGAPHAVVHPTHAQAFTYRIHWSAVFGIIYLAVAISFSIFYSLNAIEILTEADKASIKGAQLHHQRWLNFLGSAAGWVCLWFVVRKVSLDIWDGKDLGGNVADVGLALMGFVGVTGYLPYTIVTIVNSIGVLVGKLPDLFKPKGAED